MSYDKYKVLKYPFHINDKDTLDISLHNNSKLLYAEYNDKEDEGCVWALCNIRNEVNKEFFRLIRTGQEIEIDHNIQLIYIDSLNSKRGGPSYHFFKVVPYKNRHICFEQ